MGEIIIKKVKGMTMKAKISLILIFTLAIMVLGKAGWYRPLLTQAAINQSTSWRTIAAKAGAGWMTTGSAGISGTIPAIIGSNRLLVVGIASSQLTHGWISMQSVTYGGVAMTQAVGDGGVGNSAHTFLYYLKDNAVMNANGTLLIKLTGAGTHAGTDIYYATYDGVDQTTPVGAAKNAWSTALNNGLALANASWLTVNANDVAVKVLNMWRSTAAGSAPRTIASWGSNTIWNTTAMQQKTWGSNMRTAAGSRVAPTSGVLTDTAWITFSGATKSSLAAMVIKQLPDTTAPVPGTVTLSAGNATYVPAALTMTTTFSDPETGITGCEYTTNGSAWAAATWSAGTCSQALSGLTGSVTLNMRATSGGGVGTASAQIRTVDSTAPAYMWNAPTAGTWYKDGAAIGVDASITESGSGITNGATCNAKIDGGTSGFSSTVVYDLAQGKCVGSITISTPSGLSAGAHTITLQVADIIGNSAVSSTRSINIDNTAPTPNPMTLTSPADEAIDLPLNQTLSCSTATDSGSGGVQYYFDIVDTEVPPVYTNNSGWIGSASYPPPGLAYGTTYVWQVKAKDAAGNETAYSTPRSFTTIQQCFRNEPTLTFTTSTVQTVTTNGGTASYTVQLKNNDIGGCGTTTFSLTATEISDEGDNFVDAATLDAAMPPINSTALAPGATQNITLGVTARSGRTAGRAKTKMSIAPEANHNYTSYSTTATTNLNVATCTANTPQIAIGPDAGNVAKGGSLAYSISVKNMDVGAACTSVTFAVAIASETAAPSANFNSSTLTYQAQSGASVNVALNPGQTGTVTLTVSAPSGAALDAVNETQVGVTASGHGTPTNAKATTTVGNKNIHNSINTNSIKWSTVGGWGVPGGKYGEFICNTCHDQVSGTNNIKKVKNSIVTPDNSKGALPGDGLTIVFTKTTGTPGASGTLGDDSNAPRSSSNKVCEVCHTYSSNGVNGVKVHAYNQATYTVDTDGVTATSSNHKNYNAKDCIACHKHNFGFMPPADGCATCHGNPPVDVPGLADVDGKTTGSTTAGRHQLHTSAPHSYTCTNCHNGYVMPEDSTVTSGYNISLGFLNMGWRTTGSYSGQTGVSYSINGGSQAAGDGNLNCSSVYCHSIGNLSNATGTGTIVTAGGVSYRTVAWNAAAWTTATHCSMCHGDQSGKAHPVYTSGTAGSTTANSHVKHVEGSSLSCDYCHNTTTTDTAIPPVSVVDGGAHLNGIETVSFKSNGGMTGTYDSTAKTCSATYCHGTGPSLSWGSTTNCASCHDATGSALSSKHSVHYNSGTAPTAINSTNSHTTSAFVYGCGNCHPASTHAKGRADDIGPVYQDAEVGGAGTKMTTYNQGASSAPDAKGYNYTNGSCSTVCHTKDGSTAGSGIVATPTWNGTNSLGCGYCHNKVGDGSPTWSAPHSKHINTYIANTNITCEACHTGTAASNSALQATSAARDQHPDGNKNVAFGSFAGGSWSGTQCSNTYCHSNGTSSTGSHAAISWTGSYSTCAECHGNKASISTGVHAQHVALSGVTCAYCHNATATNDTTIGTPANHVNKTVTINFNSTVAPSSASYNGNAANGANVYQKTPGSAGGSCVSTSCHGGGSPAWGAATSNNSCTKCHGTPTVGTIDATNRYLVAPPTDTARSTGTATGTGQVDTTASSKIGAHQTHMRYLNGMRATSLDTQDDRCAYCHGTLPVTANHANGSAVPAFQGLATKSGTMSPSYTSGTCTNTYCHNPAGTGGTLASANNGANTAPTWTTAGYIADGTLKTDANCNKCHKLPWEVGFSSTYTHGSMTISTDCSGCHGHNGDTGGTSGKQHMDGVKYGAGSCNACHWFDTGDAGAWTTTNGISGGTGLWMSTNAWGAHAKHIKHLKARYNITLTASSTSYGDANFNAVCGVCHNQTSTNHNNTTRQLDFNGSTTHQFGASAPSWNATTRSCSNLDCHYRPINTWGSW